VIAHFSDPHLLVGEERLYGRVDTASRLGAALEQIEASTIRPDVIVFTGDLADRGEDDAYARLRALVEPVAERIGAQLVWCMGNHDERAAYARHLFGVDGDAALEPQDRVYDIRGLRIVALDSSVPGYHHGIIDESQLGWLREVLATPAEHGTIIALHHPPIPIPLNEPMAVLELDDQDAFADVVRGTDVRGILGGHLHFSTHSTFAGVPVSVASATCYTLALGIADTVVGGVDRFQAIDTVHVYADRLVHTTVPIGSAELISGHPASILEQIESLSPVMRREVLSRKDSPVNMGEVDTGQLAPGENRP
jgi:3',5'-cyclic AMP phosphodiesterase CpdA